MTTSADTLEAFVRRLEKAHLAPPPAREHRDFHDDPTVDVVVEPGPSMPFRELDDVVPTLEDHAACAAEIDLWPWARASIYARYGLADDGRRFVGQRYWEKRRAEDPALERRFAQLVDYYRAWFLEAARAAR